MKYITSLTLMAIMMIGSTAFAQADISIEPVRDNQTRKEALQELKKENVEAFKENREQAMDARKAFENANSPEAKKAIFMKAKETANKRITIAISKIENMQDRVQSRITKFEERGVDVTESQKYLDESIAQLTTVKTIQEEVVAMFDEITEETDKTEFRKVIKEKFNELKSAIKTSHKSLIESIKALKGAVSSHTEENKTEVEEVEVTSVETTN